MTNKERAEKTIELLKQRRKKKEAIQRDYYFESRARQDKFKFRKGRC